jgi:hypothetical protein
VSIQYVTLDFQKNTFYSSSSEYFKLQDTAIMGMALGRRRETLFITLKSCDKEGGNSRSVLTLLHGQIQLVSFHVISHMQIALASIINSILKFQKQFAHIWRTEASTTASATII